MMGSPPDILQRARTAQSPIVTDLANRGITKRRDPVTGALCIEKIQADEQVGATRAEERTEGAHIGRR